MDASTAGLLSGIGAAVLTGVTQYLAAVVPARRSVQQARAANDIARQQLAETRAENARRWLTTIDVMCRSDDAGERRAGLRFLRGTIRESGADPAVRALLDELAQEHIGRTLDDAQQDVQAGGELELLPPREDGRDDEGSRRDTQGGQVES